MDLTKILSISGKPGLFKVISQAKNAVIVESLTDQKRFPAFGNEKMSSLEEISVFTTGEDLPLKDVLKQMFEKLQQKEAIDPKSTDKKLSEFFYEMVPSYDPGRVYVSDIRKIVNWYNLLLTHNLLEFPEEEKPKEVKPPEEKAEKEKPVKEKPVKKK